MRARKCNINNSSMYTDQAFGAHKYSVEMTLHNVNVQSRYSVRHQRMIICSHREIYVRGTLGISRVRSTYADIIYYVGISCYTRRLNYLFWTCSKYFSVCERIDNTLLIRSSYARHTLDALEVRYSYVGTNGG